MGHVVSFLNYQLTHIGVTVFEVRKHNMHCYPIYCENFYAVGSVMVRAILWIVYGHYPP